jgi:hypothetical protein
VTNNNGFWIGWFDLLTLIHIQSSGLQVTQRYRYSIHFSVHRCTCTMILSLYKSYPGNRFISLTVTSNHTWSLLGIVWFLFLPFLQLPISRLDWTQLDSSRQLFYTPLYSVYYYWPAEHFLYPLCTDLTENSLYCWRSPFIAPLPSNGYTRYSASTPSCSIEIVRRSPVTKWQVVRIVCWIKKHCFVPWVCCLMCKFATVEFVTGQCTR